MEADPPEDQLSVESRDVVDKLHLKKAQGQTLNLDSFLEEAKVCRGSCGLGGGD